jgi:CubicO group peptidase (beta-lactamase class C family)
MTIYGTKLRELTFILCNQRSSFRAVPPMKFFVCLISLAFFSLITAAQNARDYAAVERKMRAAVDKKIVPSVVVAVARDGKIVYERAFGWADAEKKIRATVRTSYQLASVSKPMTATGLMVLHHKRLIDIDRDAEDYMQPLKFRAYEGRAANVKLRNLLNHTSGLGTYFDIAYADERLRQDDFEAAFKKYGTLFYPPGVVSEYSNLGYGLIDYIIARRSKKTFARFMDEEVFAPLGMTDSFVRKTKRKNVSIAKKYDSDLRVLPDVINNTDGAGNIYSSVRDLARFGMFHLKSNLKNQKQILSAAEIDLMQSHKEPNALYPYYDSAAYGLGWYHKADDNGHKVVWHEGGMMGASSIIRLIPEKNIAVAVIINSSNRRFCVEIADELSKIVLPEYTPATLDEDAEVANFKPYATDPDYFGEWTGTIKVDGAEIPCSLKFQPDGTAIITYADFTYKSYFTQNNPLPHKTILLASIVNREFFVGMFPGNLPSKDIRREFSQIMSLKLFKSGDRLSGAIVALAAASREYYAYPFYIKLERKN